MKIRKLIYWLSPIIAILLLIGIFFTLDWIEGVRIEEGKSYPDTQLPKEAMNIFVIIVGVAVTVIGYLVAFLYRWLRFHVSVLIGFMLFFFLIEALQDFPGIYNYDYTREGAVLTVISVCMRGIFLWCSYPVILSGLLYWCAKKLRYALDDDC